MKDEIIKIKIIDTQWQSTLFLLIGDSQDCANYVEKQVGIVIRKADKDGFLAYMNDLGKDSYLCVGRFSGSIDEMGLLCHELLHYVFAHLNWLGIKHCKKSEEVFTYYFQSLIQKITIELGKLIKNKK